MHAVRRANGLLEDLRNMDEKLAGLRTKNQQAGRIALLKTLDAVAGNIRLGKTTAPTSTSLDFKP